MDVILQIKMNGESFNIKISLLSKDGVEEEDDDMGNANFFINVNLLGEKLSLEEDTSFNKMGANFVDSGLAIYSGDGEGVNEASQKEIFDHNLSNSSMKGVQDIPDVPIALDIEWVGEVGKSSNEATLVTSKHQMGHLLPTQVKNKELRIPLLESIVGGDHRK
ncbi:hypothetical protein TanjilG_03742 [Lupinus angustifolius]|uniref:Uncharacterized protein n=1 Tax=Lupinus angustifolius TaxID=3871 RepID=A0A1J7HMH1_LUPAN|nr:hypothetical protein TanjilG_03742 [Lupinus angustifolius]